jgi:hypothetical protein
VVDVKVESPSPEKKEEAVGSVVPPAAPLPKPKKKKKKREHKPSGKAKPNPWLEHVKQFRKAHPELKFKDVLKQAKSTYKSSMATKFVQSIAPMRHVNPSYVPRDPVGAES